MATHYLSIISSLIHLFSWSGLIDSKLLMKDVFQVPNLKTGNMEPMISALTDEEEEQFKNMLNRLNTVFQVNTSVTAGNFGHYIHEQSKALLVQAVLHSDKPSHCEKG